MAEAVRLSVHDHLVQRLRLVAAMPPPPMHLHGMIPNSMRKSFKDLPCSFFFYSF
jgi:hypothetical protein